MPRLLAASGAMLASVAVLAGLVLAPHSHVHPAGSAAADDGYHGHDGGAVKHAHLTAHEVVDHHAPAMLRDEASDSHHEHDRPEILSAVDDFVFPAADDSRFPMPSVLVHIVAVAPETGRDVAANVYQPPAHGPPAGRSVRPRAPPIAPPAAA